jgi:hypothetical protein
MTCEVNILNALKKRKRITRKTAIENGWCENLTATISSLRKRGYKILTLRAKTPEGLIYTRYALAGEGKRRSTSRLSKAS